MANFATFYRRALVLLLLALSASGLKAETKPVSSNHMRCIVFNCPTEIYVVQKGDQICCIAASRETTTSHLASVNHIGSRRIFPGQKLVVPAGKSTTIMVPCVLNKHNHARVVPKPKIISAEKTVAVWGPVMSFNIPVEAEANGLPRLQVGPVILDSAKDSSDIGEEWKIIHVGKEVYRIRAKTRKGSPVVTSVTREAPKAEVETKSSTGPDARKIVASEKL